MDGRADQPTGTQRQTVAFQCMTMTQVDRYRRGEPLVVILVSPHPVPEPSLDDALTGDDGTWVAIAMVGVGAGSRLGSVSSTFTQPQLLSCLHYKHQSNRFQVPAMVTIEHGIPKTVFFPKFISITRSDLVCGFLILLKPLSQPKISWMFNCRQDLEFIARSPILLYSIAYFDGDVGHI